MLVTPIRNEEGTILMYVVNQEEITEEEIVKRLAGKFKVFVISSSLMIRKSLFPKFDKPALFVLLHHTP